MANPLSAAASGAAAGSVVPGIGTAVGAIGGILASILGSGQNSAASQQLQADIQKLEAQGIPSVDAQKLALDKYVNAGNLDPSLESAYKQADTEYKKIQTNPAYRAAQVNALQQLEQLGTSGGLTINDKANIQKGELEASAADRGRREAIVSNAASRGVGNSGTALAAELSGIQQTNDQQAKNALDTMGSARARALQAIEAGGTLGGQLETQDYGEQANKAAAEDAIQKFNTSNLQGVADRNTNTINAAKARNLNNDQEISNLNTTTQNNEQTYNSKLIQQQFEDELQKQQAVLGAETGAVGQGNIQNKNNATMAGNIGSAIAAGGAAVDAATRAPTTATAGSPNATAGANDSDYNAYYGTDENDNDWWK